MNHELSSLTYSEAFRSCCCWHTPRDMFTTCSNYTINVFFFPWDIGDENVLATKVLARTQRKFFSERFIERPFKYLTKSLIPMVTGSCALVLVFHRLSKCMRSFRKRSETHQLSQKTKQISFTSCGARGYNRLENWEIKYSQDCRNRFMKSCT